MTYYTSDIDAAVDYLQGHGLVYDNDDGFCLFYRVDDVTLDKIKRDVKVLLDIDYCKRLCFMTGNNIHIVRVYKYEHCHNFSRVIMQSIRDICTIYNPSTISWWSQDQDRFVIARRSV